MRMRLRNFPGKENFIELSRTSNVIPVGLEILADMDTPVTIMRKIYPNDGPAFLFESVEGGERYQTLLGATGTGKTFTSFLWALNQLITGAWESGRSRVLYISPLKALNNVIQRNLRLPLAGIRRVATFVDGNVITDIMS